MMDDVFVLPIADRKLLFCPRRYLAALVSPSAVRAVLNVRGNGSSDEQAPADLRELLHNLRQEPRLVVPREGPPRPNFLGLIVTRDCNMACKYCDFQAGDDESHSMRPELAVAAIDAWVEHQMKLGEDNLELHFFGGEPFVAPDVIEVAVHRTRALAATHGANTRFEACTNGLLDERSLGFVANYFDTIVLSLDGLQTDHDRHRPLHGGRSGFDHVCRTARALSASPVELCLRCCVSSENVSRMAAIAGWFVDAFHPSMIDFESLKSTPEAAAAGLQPPDPRAFATGFIEAGRIARQGGTECVYAAAFAEPRCTFCPVGRDTFILSPNGSIRSCYLPSQQWKLRGLDLEIGHVPKEGGLVIDQPAVERLRHSAANRDRCRKCFCRWSCAGGCLVSETFPGHSLEYSDFCRQTRIIQACLLLEDLGQSEMADQLLSTESAIETLCRQTDDTLGDHSA